MLTWLLTWSDDVKWHQQGFFSTWKGNQKPRRHLWAHVGEIDNWTSQVLQICELRGWLSGECDHNPIWDSRILGVHGRRSQSHCPHVVACAVANGGRVPRLWSREVVEHVCGVGFIRQSLDLQKSEKASHGLLGCWILTQHCTMVAARCRGCKIPQTSMWDFRWWSARENLLCMLNILATRYVIPCCVC